MDAGKINSLIPNLRSGDGGARSGNAQSDAAFAAKIAAAVVLDDLLKVTEGEAPASAIPLVAVPSAPRSGVVVNLSSGVVAAEMAARAGHPLSRPNEHSTAKSENAAPANPPGSARVYVLTERLGESLRGNAETFAPTPAMVANDRRAIDPPIAISTPQIVPRADILALVAPAGVPMNRLELPEQRSSVAAAIEQARDSERLAGLNSKREAPVMPRWVRLDRLVLAAIVLGLALVILL